MQEAFGLEFFPTYFIRCPTCGTLISPLKNKYLNLVESGFTRELALDEVGLKNPCCRAKMLIPVQWPRIRVDDKKVFGVEEPKITLPQQTEKSAKELAGTLLQGFSIQGAPALNLNPTRRNQIADDELKFPKKYGVPAVAKEIYFQETSTGPVARMAKSIFLT